MRTATHRMSDHDDPVGTCPCGGEVYEHRQRGARPYMARFQEPDSVWLQCATCGCAVDEDELVPEEEDEEDDDA